jgi:hypothetical protein
MALSIDVTKVPLRPLTPEEVSKLPDLTEFIIDVEELTLPDVAHNSEKDKDDN